MLTVAELWHSCDPTAWAAALDRYWHYVRPANLALERALDRLDLDRLRDLDPQGWYDFLHDEYFRWKFTAPNRYVTTTRTLGEYLNDADGLKRLFQIKQHLLELDRNDVESALSAVCKANGPCKIRGLGTAGASGLLALMYPANFATVDQFVVKALRDVGGLPEADALVRMRPNNITIRDAVILVEIMAGRAAENNRLFGTSDWTPRKIDQVLWTYGR